RCRHPGEAITPKRGAPAAPSLAPFDIPPSLDVGDIESAVLEVPERRGPYGARGVGEMTTISTAPAIAAAVHDAVGVWIDELPVTAEKVVRALKEKEFQGKDVREEGMSKVARSGVRVSPSFRIISSIRA
ncbi:hypothetical protein HKBW3S47_01712, partial [Candidatus Hakubella thermalkaliphila]